MRSAIGMAFVVGFVLYGCITSPTVTEKTIRLGMSKAEVEEYFAEQNNRTGQWKSVLVGQRNSEKGIESIFIYKWQSSSEGYRHVVQEIPIYELIFRGDELVSYKQVGSLGRHKSSMSIGIGTQPKQGMSFMCKDAISRGDQGGIFVFC